MCRTPTRVLAAAALLCLALAQTGAARRLLANTTTATAIPQTYIIVFGDSASATLGKSINMSKPTATCDPVTGYANGRWSNGPVWIDYVSSALTSAQIKTTVKNYAIGGATACKPQPLFASSPYLAQQTSQFQTDVKNGAVPKPSATTRVLPIQFIGGNDVMQLMTTSIFRSSNWYNTQAAALVACRMANVDAIAAAGYKDIVLLPVQSVNAAPVTMNYAESDTNKLVDAMNAALVSQVAAKQAAYDAAPAGSATAGTKLWLLTNADTGDVLPFPVTNRGCWDLPEGVPVVTAAIAPMYTKCSDPQNYNFFDNVHTTTNFHSWFAQNPASGLLPQLQALNLLPPTA